MLERGHVPADRGPGAFRCLVCRRYLTATSTGHCPCCGFAPPHAPPTPPPAYGERPLPRDALLLVVTLLAFAVAWLGGA